MFGDAIDGAGRPGAVAMPAQVHGVDVKMLAERARHPVPVAGMIQAAMHQQERRKAILSPVPELQLQAIGIVIVRDGFQLTIVRVQVAFYLLPRRLCSRTSEWCRTSIPLTRKSTSSAMLVAWSAMRSRLWAMNIRSTARGMVVLCSCMKATSSL